MSGQKDPREKFAQEEIKELAETLEHGEPLSPYQLLIYAYCLKGPTTSLREPARESFVEPNKVIHDGGVLYEGFKQGLVPRLQDWDLLKQPEGWYFLQMLLEGKPDDGNFYNSSLTLCESRVAELNRWGRLSDTVVYDCDTHVTSLKNTIAMMKGGRIEVNDANEA